MLSRLFLVKVAFFHEEFEGFRQRFGVGGDSCIQ